MDAHRFMAMALDPGAILRARSFAVGRWQQDVLLAVSGGTGTYSNLQVTGLPPGLSASISGSTIAITGTPTQSGTYANIVVSLQDSNNDQGGGTFSLTINPSAFDYDTTYPFGKHTLRRLVASGPWKGGASHGSTSRCQQTTSLAGPRASLARVATHRPRILRASPPQ
jgi:Putative Ig domain